MEELNEVVFPEERVLLRLVIHLPTNEITSDSHEVGLLLPHDHFNHFHCFVVTLFRLTKLQISQLHDPVLVIGVDLQVHDALVVFVVALV